MLDLPLGLILTLTCDWGGVDEGLLSVIMLVVVAAFVAAASFGRAMVLSACCSSRTPAVAVTVPCVRA